MHYHVSVLVKYFIQMVVAVPVLVLWFAVVSLQLYVHFRCPDDSLTIHKMALSIGFQDLFPPPCYPSYRALASTLVSLSSLNAPAFAGHTSMPVYPGALTSPFALKIFKCSIGRLLSAVAIASICDASYFDVRS